ncbi:hypothetical protein LMG3458_03885 [Achromobacter deleyi]|jgi:hypothetical protein|uniref:Uncharacterized protein n=1 Tax=Achromobacter deleyi TaxID=1353891 RepID=A0A6S7BLY8_9BURK|nr:hypothetical protein LMG3458_03885 [Achromobacter deleyi]CAB3845121.1 hypothetical protein LMG3412_01458 [Achromobacter deleyi]CAB3891653.1 hypothetical protein LMG3482_03827 [Achromobacter deleyi]CAB3916192.1 hypothetical protein LMG3481_05054 [Achromobacter deleyi]
MKDPYKCLLVARVAALLLIWLLAFVLTALSVWQLP